jgi:hypothetical protein
VFIAPVADPLPGAQHQSHDRAITSRTLLHRNAFRHSRVHVSRQQPWFTTA